MKILFLAPLVPHPLTDGGRQRMHNVLGALVEKHSVVFAGFGSTDEVDKWPLATSLARVVVDGADALPTDRESAADVAGLPYWAQPASFQRINGSGLWRTLESLPLDSFDAVHVVTSVMAPFGIAIKRLNPGVRLVLDLPDITWHLRYRALTSMKGWWRTRTNVLGLVDAARFLALESSMIPRYDRVFVCSTADASRVSRWANQGRVVLVPNCTNAPISAPEAAPPSSRDLAFVGMMSYAPNEEAVKFFCADVWPRIRVKCPDARFWIVGKSPTPHVTALSQATNGIIVTGEVPDVRPYLERSAAVVVPLLSGGGTRLKILEAMAHGRAVVSTSIGAEGLDTVHGKNVLIADSAEELASQCIAVLTDRTTRDRIANGGLELVRRSYDWTVARERVQSCYTELATSADGAHPSVEPHSARNDLLRMPSAN